MPNDQFNQPRPPVSFTPAVTPPATLRQMATMAGTAVFNHVTNPRNLIGTLHPVGMTLGATAAYAQSLRNSRGRGE